MNKKRILTLTCIVALLIVLYASFVAAGPLQNLQNFFTSGYKNYNKLLDFMVFTILFFAAAYLGFSRWFGGGFGNPGDARGAVVGLSLALSLALSFAIITQTNFSLTSLFPISLLMIFFILVLLIYGLLQPAIDNWFLRLLLSLIVAYLLFSVFLFFYCSDPDTQDSTICRASWMKWATFWQNAFGTGRTSSYVSTGEVSSTSSGTGTETTAPAAGPAFSKSFCHAADHLPMQSRFYPEVKADDGIVHHQEVINYIYLQAGWDYKTYPEGELVPEETAQQAFRVEAQKYGLDITKDLVNPGRKKVFAACIDYKNMADAVSAMPEPSDDAEPSEPEQPDQLTPPAGETPTQPAPALTGECQVKAQQYKALLGKYAENAEKGVKPELSLLELNEMKELRTFLSTDVCMSPD